MREKLCDTIGSYLLCKRGEGAQYFFNPDPFKKCMGLGVIKYYLKNGVSLLNQFEVIFPILEIPLSIDKNSDFFSTPHL